MSIHNKSLQKVSSFVAHNHQELQDLNGIYWELYINKMPQSMPWCNNTYIKYKEEIW